MNYGRKEYDPYPSVINARNRYDRLGNYLSRGFNVFTWEFSRPGESNINTRTAQYLGWFANLVMLNDSYKGWNYRVTLGEDIRAKFSDLTFSDPRFLAFCSTRFLGQQVHPDAKPRRRPVERGQVFDLQGD